MPVVVDIDVMMARRKMGVGELAERIGITPTHLSVMKNGRVVGSERVADVTEDDLVEMIVSGKNPLREAA